MERVRWKQSIDGTFLIWRVDTEGGLRRVMTFTLFVVVVIAGRECPDLMEWSVYGRWSGQD